MIEASACYRKSGATASKPVKRATKKSASSAKKATYRGSNPSSSSNPWIAHVQAYRASHECSYAEAMQGAKKTYRSLQELIKNHDHILLELEQGCRLEKGNTRLLCRDGPQDVQVLSLWREGTANAHPSQTFEDFIGRKLPISYHGIKYFIDESMIKTIT